MRVTVWMALIVLSACNSEQGRNERRGIVHEDVPSVKRVIRDDIDRTRRGIQAAADRLAPGFLVDDPERREHEMRVVMIRMRQPPRGIPELMVSPISFLAVVGADGKVICRDASEDRMRGFDLGHASAVVQRALSEGVAADGVNELPALEEGQPASVTMLFAVPARRNGQIVGAVVAGLPLWRLSQQ